MDSNTRHPATIYAAGSTASAEVEVSVSSTSLTVHFADGDFRNYQLIRQKVTERIAGMAATVTLEDGRTLSIPDGEVARKIQSRGKRTVSWLEKYFLLSLPVLIVLAVAFYYAIHEVFLPAIAPVITSKFEAKDIENWEDSIFVEIQEREFLEPLTEPEHELQRQRLTELGERVAAATDSEFSYEFILIDSEGLELNAFALPGGRILVTEKLAETLSDEQLLAVLAHEIGHVKLRHSINSIIKAAAFSVLISFMFGDITFASLPVAISSLSYSRIDEQAADCFAAKLLPALGIQPAAVQEALTKIDDYYRINHPDNRKYVPEFLTSHPTYHNRIRSLEACASQPLIASPPE